MRGDLYAYGRPREPAMTMQVDAPGDLAFVCDVCGCSAVTGDRRLLTTIGWTILPTRKETADRPALCPRCAGKPPRRI